ncbi:MAG: flavin reductase family protein [Alphaproteobacteria bacterium]|nr:flavin reductase family protein [Alphaproteobacteria bacterium]
MTKITWKPGTMLAPVPPALISCGTMEKPNVMTAAWTGIICSDPTLVYVSIRPSRFSNTLIRETGEFVINVPTIALAKAVDLCGVKSGRNTDKFKLAHITPEPCSVVSAPQIKESPVSLECKVKNITSYGTHDMFLAEVVAVNVDDAYINSAQALDLSKAGLLAYAHGFYYTLGKKIGKFGWSVEKKSTKRKRAARLSQQKSATLTSVRKHGKIKKESGKK